MFSFFSKGVCRVRAPRQARAVWRRVRSRVSQGPAAGCCRQQAGGRPVDAPPDGRAGGARRQLVFEELLGRAKERAAKEEKRAKRARDDFAAMLRGAKDLDPDAPWEDAKAALAREPEYKAVRARRSRQHRRMPL